MINRPHKDKGYDVDFLNPGEVYRPAWGQRSEAFRASTPCQLDVSYQHGPRGRLDFFPTTDAANAPTLIFIHGGYWQKGDKSFYSFVAEPYVLRGVSCIIINYDFCPSVRITQITEQVRAAMRWIWQNGPAVGIARDQLHIAGHSAGAHLAAMMMTTDWPGHHPGMPAALIHSATLVSGIYDLAPLLQEPANDQLRLDVEEVEAQSPVHRRSATDAPQLVAYGEQESDAFHAQSTLYASTFSSSSRALECYEVQGCHHFDIMNAYADPESTLFSKCLALIKQKH